MYCSLYHESVVDTIVLADLKRVTEYARSHTEEFYAMATENGEAEAKKFYASAEKKRNGSIAESRNSTISSVAYTRIG